MLRDLALVCLPALWVLGYLAYAVLARGAATPAVAAARAQAGKVQVSPWLPRSLIEFGYFVYAAPIRLCVRLGIGADALTWASLGLSLAAAAAVGCGWFSLGGWTLLLAFTCDGMDGVLARALGTSSQRGEFLDAVVDRYSDLIAFSGYAFYYRHDTTGLLLVLSALSASTVVSYARARAGELAVRAEMGYMRRFERAVWLGAGTVLAPLAAAWIEPGAARPRYHLALLVMALLGVLGHVTAGWRIRHVLRVLQERGRAR
jgi:CDP-diacylglycerol---glycerol-3-phosphate 3-phosphatidyltransferase